MNNSSDEINKFLENKEFIGGLLYLVEQIVTKPQYEYIQVYYDGELRSNFLGVKYGFYGFRIRGAYTNNIKMENDYITLFNKLGSRGWKLFSVTPEGYLGQTDSGKVIQCTRNIYIFERKASANSELGLDKLLDMLDIKRAKSDEESDEASDEESDEASDEADEAIESEETENEDADPLSLCPIEELQLSVRAYHPLKRAGIHSIKDLLEYTRTELSEILKHRRSEEEVVETLKKRFDMILNDD